MPFQQSGEIRYFTFAGLPDTAVAHAIFTRRGGVSPAPWDALNVGSTVGDVDSRVTENRIRAFAALSRKPDSLCDVWQVHGNKVVHARKPRALSELPPRADILLTDRPELTLFMRFADCVPIMLFDPVHRVVGLVHTGWQGTVQRAVAIAVKTMTTSYRTNPKDVIAGIGPSIGPHHYDVGPEVVARVSEVFSEQIEKVLYQNDSTVQFDLWSANRILLQNAGVEQIEIAGICTACNPDDWFSHRGEGGRTGRFGALIAIK